MLEYDELYEQRKQKIWYSFDEWLKEGSGWRIQSVDRYILKMYKPIQGSSYIKSPKNIELTHAVSNVQNNDNKCFLRTFLAKLHPAEKNTERVSHYEKYMDEIPIENIRNGVHNDQILK